MKQFLDMLMAGGIAVAIIALYLFIQEASKRFGPKRVRNTILLLFVLGAAPFLLRYASRLLAAQRLSSVVQLAITAAASLPTVMPPPNPTQCTPQHFVVVNLGDSTLDDSHFSLPATARARSLDDALTFVIVRRGETTEGAYVSTSLVGPDRPTGLHGYTLNAQVTVLDRRSGQILASHQVYGSSPPRTTRISGSRTGSRPVAEIAQYLMSLTVCTSDAG